MTIHCPNCRGVPKVQLLEKVLEGKEEIDFDFTLDTMSIEDLIDLLKLLSFMSKKVMDVMESRE